MLEITRIPRSSRYVEGIINVRGQIVPVISLHRLFRATYSVDLLNTYILVGRAQSQPVGLILDSVTQLHDVDPGQLEPSSPSDPLAALLPWVVKHDEGILFILDLNQLVALKDAPALVARIGADALDGEEKPISPEVRAVLRQRAAQLRQVSTGEGVESRTFFTFALGQEKYAVSADNAERVLVPPEIVSVPGTPHQFAGMMNYSGDVLWVLDPKTLLGLTPSLPGNAERVLILDYGGDRFGLLIDTAFAVASVPASAIRGSLVGADKARDDYVAGEIYWRDELIAILDFSTLSAEKVLHTVE
jgi:chemotaxis signal transduction protein